MSPAAARVVIAAALIVGIGAAVFALTRRSVTSPGWSGALGKLRCPYGMEDAGQTTGSTELAYEKGCKTSADCAIGFHNLDCCGTAIVLGVNASELSRFSRDDGICGVPATCRCASRGVAAEDGNSSVGMAGYGDVAAACVGGRCLTHILPDAGAAMAAPRSTATATAGPTATATTPGSGLFGNGGCPVPSPADCSVPGSCKPSACVCRQGSWVCTPDCGGCVKAVPVTPVPFDR